MTRSALRHHGATAVLVLCLLVLAGALVLSGSGLRLVTVRSSSMAPALPEGALLLESYEPLADLEPGMVITFHAPTPDARLLTHRVVTVERPEGRTVVRTRGDGNPGDDPWQAELLGDRVWVVQAGVSGLGRVVDVVESPVALALIAVVLPGIFAVSSLRRIWRPGGPPRGSCGQGRVGRPAAAVLVAATPLAVLAGPAPPAVAAFTGSASGGHSVTTAVLVAPASVTLQDACPVSGQAVDVFWSAVDSGQTGFLVERRDAPALVWTALATVAAGDRAYQDPTVAPLGQYTYRVSAVRGSWSSAPTESASLTLTGTCGA